MCEVRISAPPIEEQRKAVASWQGLRKMKADNDNLKDQLATDLTTLLYTEGYPPDWDDEIFHRVLEQMENYKRHQGS